MNISSIPLFPFSLHQADYKKKPGKAGLFTTRVKRISSKNGLNKTFTLTELPGNNGPKKLVFQNWFPKFRLSIGFYFTVRLKVKRKAGLRTFRPFLCPVCCSGAFCCILKTRTAFISFTNCGNLGWVCSLMAGEYTDWFRLSQ